MKGFLGFILVIVVIVWVINFIEDSESTSQATEEKVTEIVEDVSRVVTENTVTTKRALQSQKDLEVYKNAYLREGYNFHKDFEFKGYQGYFLRKGDIIFTIAFSTKFIGPSGVVITDFFIYNENQDKGFLINRLWKEEFSFYYFNPTTFESTSSEPFKDAIYFSSLPLEMLDVPYYKAYSEDVQEIIDIFKETKSQIKKGG